MSQPSTPDANFADSNHTQLQLVVHAGPLAGKGYPILKEALTFGRDEENDITLDDEEVSRYHAQLVLQEDTVFIEDLGSTNGTQINGNRIEGRHEVQPTDIISMGSSIFGVKGFSAPTTVQYSQPPTEHAPDISSPPPRAPSTRAPSSKPRKVRKQQSGGNVSGVSLLLLSAGLAFFIIILVVLAGFFYVLSQGSPAQVATVPKVVITTPLNNSEVQIGTPLTIQATASDSNGIIRAELWVDAVKQDEEISPAPDGQITLAVSFQWTPQTAGNHQIEVRAYNSLNAVNTPTVLSVKATDSTTPTEMTDTPTPTLTPVSETSTPPPPEKPSLLALTDLNVMAGPSRDYDLLGLLPAQAEAEILGQDNTRQWWQIRFAPASDGVGWVISDPNFSEPKNIENIPIVVSPPTPTGTPTETAIPPTDTPTSIPPTDVPTNTPVPPTDTPTPVPEVKIDFEISPKRIDRGDCVDISWNVTGVKEIYIQDNGVGGQGEERTCPTETITYELRVVKMDDTEETKEITVEVEGEDTRSSGSKTLDPNETFDFDDGTFDEDGADFKWFIEDGTRRFEALENVDMASMSTIDSLGELNLDDCEDADYNKYRYIDASDDASDSGNILLDGRAVCYKTNEGRYGKLWLPNYSTDELEVEWVTWR